MVTQNLISSHFISQNLVEVHLSIGLTWFTESFIYIYSVSLLGAQ